MDKIFGKSSGRSGRRVIVAKGGERTFAAFGVDGRYAQNAGSARAGLMSPARGVDAPEVAGSNYLGKGSR